jgi:hypothetical protein
MSRFRCAGVADWGTRPSPVGGVFNQCATSTWSNGASTSAVTAKWEPAPRMGTGASLANTRHLRSQCKHRHGGAPRLQSGHGHPSDAASLPAASPHPDPAHQHSNLHHAPGRQLATTSR